jgi:hypothetical protein
LGFIWIVFFLGFHKLLSALFGYGNSNSSKHKLVDFRGNALLLQGDRHNRAKNQDQKSLI